MEQKYTSLFCPLCGEQLLDAEMVRDLTQEVGARDGVGKSVLHCEDCNTSVGLLVASDSRDWLLFLIPPELLDDTFEIIIKLRENCGWPVSKINMVLESLLPKAKQ